MIEVDTYQPQTSRIRYCENASLHPCHRRKEININHSTQSDLGLNQEAYEPNQTVLWTSCEPANPDGAPEMTIVCCRSTFRNDIDKRIIRSRSPRGSRWANLSALQPRPPSKTVYDRWQEMFSSSKLFGFCSAYTNTSGNYAFVVSPAHAYRASPAQLLREAADCGR